MQFYFILIVSKLIFKENKRESSRDIFSRKILETKLCCLRPSPATPSKEKVPPLFSLYYFIYYYLF